MLRFQILNKLAMLRVTTHSENTLRHYLADAAVNNQPPRQHADS